MDEANSVAIHQKLARKRKFESDLSLGCAHVIPRKLSISHQRLRCNQLTMETFDVLHSRQPLLKTTNLSQHSSTGFLLKLNKILVTIT